MTDQGKKDLAQSYQTMMELAAWKHFATNTLDRIDTQASSDEDSIPIVGMSLAEVGECRGRRNAIRKIKSDLSYILEGGNNGIQ